MRAIRSKNTKPEIILRKLLFARGFRFRLHIRDLPGQPDIVLPKYRVAIFVHGCFWHGHDCYLFKLPQTRTAFWEEKIGQNRIRDRRDAEALHRSGWRVLSVWECALKGSLKWDIVALGDVIAAWIGCGQPGSAPTELRHAMPATPPLLTHAPNYSV